MIQLKDSPPIEESIKSIGVRTDCLEKIRNFPPTKFMGSKYSLLPFIWDCVKDLKFESVLDLFSGTGCVSYMFKKYGKEVISNDFLTFCYHFSKATIENNTEILNPSDINLLLSPNKSAGTFISDTFKNLYFNDKENQFLDSLSANIDLLKCEYKKSIALAAISRACLKKRPRGLFTFIGNQGDDGRKDFRITLQEHFINNIAIFNKSIFDNNYNNKSYNADSLFLYVNVDLIYIDPPYITPYSDNDYTRRYHFIEGFCKKWKGLNIQWNTKTKKFKQCKTLFSSKNKIYDAFETIFYRYQDKIIVLSYSSNSIPTKEEIITLLKRYKKKVNVYQIKYKYKFGNQGHKIHDNNNDVYEYIYIGE